jgi:hypothetical protein
VESPSKSYRSITLTHATCKASDDGSVQNHGLIALGRQGSECTEHWGPTQFHTSSQTGPSEQISTYVVLVDFVRPWQSEETTTTHAGQNQYLIVPWQLTQAFLVTNIHLHSFIWYHLIVHHCFTWIKLEESYLNIQFPYYWLIQSNLCQLFTTATFWSVVNQMLIVLYKLHSRIV